MTLLRRVAAGALLLLLGGCGRNEIAGAPTNSAPQQTQSYLNHAQPRLPSIKLWIGAQEMVTEMCLTPTQTATGMMYRKQMGENEGMIFVFGRPHRTAFYMRNTTVPLSAAYIDPEGTILEIHDLQPLNETPVEASTDKIQYVLETPQGWFKKNNIGVGTLIRTERGSLQETFFRKQQ
jgi:uncharacterized membrane protein (UPF0127 family)